MYIILSPFCILFILYITLLLFQILSNDQKKENITPPQDTPILISDDEDSDLFADGPSDDEILKVI